MDGSGQVRFDGWTLHARTGELQRGDVRVRLQSQPQQVLEALLERPGELVTREELIARLWPRGVVEFDATLNSAVRRLRTALGDDADAPRYIETIPRRGYHFIGRVVPIADTPPSIRAAAAPSVAPAAPTEAAPARGPWGPVAAGLLVIVLDSIRVVYALEADSTAESRAFSRKALPSSYGSVGSRNTATTLGNGVTRASRTQVSAARDSPDAEPRAYRIRQVAELLNCPPSTVYDMVRTGALASVRTGKDRGGVVLVPASAVEQFLEQKKRRR